MANSTLLPLVKGNLENIMWCVLNTRYQKHFKDYTMNRSVFVVCKALENIDLAQSKELQKMALILNDVDSKETVGKCIAKLSKPAISEGFIVALLSFAIELCVLYLQKDRVDKVDIVLNELQIQFDKFHQNSNKVKKHKFMSTFGWISLLAIFLYNFEVLIE